MKTTTKSEVKNYKKKLKIDNPVCLVVYISRIAKLLHITYSDVHAMAIELYPQLMCNANNNLFYKDF